MEEKGRKERDNSLYIVLLVFLIKEVTFILRVQAANQGEEKGKTNQL